MPTVHRRGARSPWSCSSSRRPEEKLRSTWDGLVAQVGSYVSHGEPVDVSAGKEPFVVFDTPMQFERAELKSRVVFDADGTIGGLFLLRPDAP